LATDQVMIAVFGVCRRAVICAVGPELVEPVVTVALRVSVAPAASVTTSVKVVVPVTWTVAVPFAAFSGDPLMVARLALAVFHVISAVFGVCRLAVICAVMPDAGGGAGVGVGAGGGGAGAGAPPDPPTVTVALRVVDSPAALVATRVKVVVPVTCTVAVPVAAFNGEPLMVARMALAVLQVIRAVLGPSRLPVMSAVGPDGDGVGGGVGVGVGVGGGGAGAGGPDLRSTDASAEDGPYCTFAS
jgi:hypothetical protein